MAHLPPDLEAIAAARGNNWINHVARNRHEIPDLVAFRYAGESRTWREFADRIDALACVLYSLGVRSGDRIMILMSNRPEYFEALIASNKIGAIPVPTSTRLSAGEQEYIAQNSGIRGIVCDGPEVSSAIELAGNDRFILAVGGLAADRVISYERALAAEHPAHPIIPIADDNVALIMYTAGTTGRPKGAMLSHTNIQFSASSLQRAYRMVDTTSIALCASPLFHIAAIGMVIPFIFTGSRTVISHLSNFDADLILDLLEAEEVTTAFFVPSQWELLCAQAAKRKMSTKLKIMNWGAAPATTTLLRAMALSFPSAVTVAGFGQTEMSPVACVLSGDDAKRKLGSVGKPVAGVTARIVDSEMNDVYPGETGEIVYRGPGVMLGYWRDPAATAEAFRGGFFHSGDLVRADDEGFLYVMDRMKDMIISGGENIYSAEIENVLARHPQVREVAVVGLPHEKWGETPVAAIVSNDSDNPPTFGDLSAWCRQSLASYKKPTRIVVLPHLPKSSTGKILKSELRQSLQDTERHTQKGFSNDEA